MRIFWPARYDVSLGLLIGDTYWLLRSPWSPRYFAERNGHMRVWSLGFGWRLTQQRVLGV
jgi:hypothetical protein